MQVIRTIVYKIPVDKATQEVILEVLRWVVFIAVSAVVTALLELFAEIEPTTTTMALTIILRASDRWIYEHKKQKPKVKSPMGLTF